MIAIVNVGPFNDPDPNGWRKYEIRINRMPACRKDEYGNVSNIFYG